MSKVNPIEELERLVGEEAGTDFMRIFFELLLEECQKNMVFDL